MKVVRHGAVVLACVAIAAMATACSSKELDVPGKFCGAPLKKSTLSALLPDGDEVKTQQDGSAATEIVCSLNVAGSRVLNSTIRTLDGPLASEDWDTALSKYKNAKKREVSFPGAAVIGADGARITAKCQNAAPSDSLLFNIDLFGSQVENSEAGAAKLQKFLQDYVPAMTKQLDCTT
ncbi:hypothetical protein [Streptomyces sp. NBC_01446]|uniref:hypothetical protein n=1 Tax=Streptomyces sp. NBC_01446 TaxID=2903870 RepID=UPI00224CD0F0|nr:hypothetical protein [Streptomyces sp. NBC_01446]MCX4641784.1 hypothetical protein [Streptomyces sp. NBC_01446]